MLGKTYSRGAELLLFLATSIAMVVGLLAVTAVRARSKATRRLAAISAILIVIATGALVTLGVWYFSHWSLRF